MMQSIMQIWINTLNCAAIHMYSRPDTLIESLVNTGYHNWPFGKLSHKLTVAHPSFMVSEKCASFVLVPAKHEEIIA